MSFEPLLITLTFDAEADVFDPSIGQAVGSAQSWRGIEEGIPMLDKILAHYQDSSGARACATWFVRCDDQIADLCGEPASLLKRYEDCWRRHEEMGDEIGFHPHLYEKRDGVWLQETDEAALRGQIYRAYEAMQKAGYAGCVSRIGEAFSSSGVMRVLDELGVICDSTAMPGRVRQDATRQLDWSGTPERPYYPSRTDYRVGGEDALSLLEVPMTMVSTKASYDREPLKRYVDLSFHHSVLREGLRSALPELRVLVTVTHPSTILGGIASAPHGLLSFAAGELVRNLEFILSECTRLGREYRFVTLGGCVSHIKVGCGVTL
jgi:hypothetical protein